MKKRNMRSVKNRNENVIIQVNKEEINTKRKKKIMEETVETSNSTKKIKNKMSIGIKGITYKVKDKSQKIYSRVEIIKIATDSTENYTYT